MLRKTLILTVLIFSVVYKIYGNIEHQEGFPIIFEDYQTLNPIVTEELNPNYEGKELLFFAGGAYYGNSEMARLLCYSSSGELIFEKILWYNFKYYSYKPVIADIDGNGSKEIIVSYNSEQGFCKINVLNNDGSEYSTNWPVTINNDYGITNITVGDIDNNGDLEIATIINRNELIVYNHDASIVWTYTLSQEWDMIWASPVISDLDFDNNKEIIFLVSNSSFTSNNSQLYILDSNGLILPGWPIDFDIMMPWMSPVVGDFDQDNNYLEIIVADGNLSTIVHCFNIDGSYANGWPVEIPCSANRETSTNDLFYIDEIGNTLLTDRNRSNGSSPIVVVDLNNDENLEVLIAGNNELHILNSNGTFYQPFSALTLDGSIYSPAVGDVNSDGNLDIVFMSFEAHSQKIYGYDSYGNQLNNFPIIVKEFDENSTMSLTRSRVNTPTFDDIDYDGDLEIIVSAWFDTYNLNWINSESNWYNPSSPYYHDIEDTIDSEIFFHYLMKFVIDNGGNMIAGINEAVTQNYIGGNDVYVDIEDRLRTPDQDQYGYWRDVVNFVISDGENLYVFRNSPEVDAYHELSYNDNGTFYSVKTLAPEGGVLIDQFDLVKISRDEEPVEFPNFLDIDYKTFSLGYNWTSFPRLVRNENINEEVDIVPILGTIEPFGDIENIIFDAYGQSDLEYDNFTWNPGDYDIQSTALYKIKIDPNEERALEVEGTRMEYNYSLADPLAAYDYHWLGYWLPEPQNIEDALGDYWGTIRSVSAEDWYWFDGLPERDGEPIPVCSWRTEGKTMEYGKGYVIKFYEEIENFHWTRSGIIEEPERKKKSENFNYAEKAEYEVIDVIGIDSRITEIGVYENDVCVGAVVVKDSSEQILVYSDNANRDPVPFTFEVTIGRGSSIPIQDYSTLNLRTGEYEEIPVISGRQEYSVIKFGKQEEPENNIAMPILLGNYPNPFNPTTSISFSLPNEQDIELSIYNIKGQKVKTLYSGSADKGKHSMVWEGKDTNDKSVSSGLYFYKLKTNNNVLARKMIMLK